LFHKSRAMSVILAASAVAAAAAAHPLGRRSGAQSLSMLVMLILAVAMPTAADDTQATVLKEYSVDDVVGPRSADESGSNVYQLASSLGLPPPPDSQLVHFLLKLLAPHLAPANNNLLEADYTNPKLPEYIIVPSTQHMPKHHPLAVLQVVQDNEEKSRPMKREVSINDYLDKYLIIMVILLIIERLSIFTTFIPNILTKRIQQILIYF
ncbi:unnamed protein product, partial [Meganyctiphanes norvegica]